MKERYLVCCDVEELEDGYIRDWYETREQAKKAAEEYCRAMDYPVLILSVVGKVFQKEEFIWDEQIEQVKIPVCAK